MCGIWALINKNENTEELKKYLNDFWNIQHRGPDNSHLETFENVYVGFHRLAIMDTSFKSNQPYVIQERDRTIVFVCNGEIYNYIDIDKKYNLNVGTSDCLVIPKLYTKTNSLDFVNELQGEYAFMLYVFDHMKKLKEYYICRDTIGIRPLYMVETNDALDMYASEIKGMDSILYNVMEFPPGHIKHVDCTGFDYTEHLITTQLYNDTYMTVYDEYSNDEPINLKQIRDSVYNSIKRRLDADRPIAFLLSGGVDSSLVAAISAKILGQPIRTFCCGMPGSTDMEMARRVSKHIGSNHTEVFFTREEGLEAINDVIYTTETWDTTTIRASVGQYMVSKYIGKHTDCRVVIVGEGPDELCSSYLFNYYAPSCDELDKCSKEYVRNIHLYDGRRADRCVSRWGIEARIPFLDPEFIKTYWNISSKLRMPTEERMEKYLFRKAFDGLNLLPDEVLWRKKEAFSDGVSCKEDSWHSIIQTWCREELAKLYSTDVNAKTDIDKLTELNNTPVTDEALWFRYVFHKYFGSKRDNIIPRYWQPKWDKNGNEIVEYIDPSARVLDIYNS